MSKARGIVLESNNGCSTILMEGGHYIKINKTMEVGQIYQQKRNYYKILLSVAALMILMLLGTVDFFNVVAYARVSNGIEMGINRWNRVVEIKQTETTATTPEYNELKGQKLEKAVSIVVKDAFAEYNKEQGLTVQVNSDKKMDPELEEKILKKIESSVKVDFSIPVIEKNSGEKEIKNSINIKPKNTPQKSINAMNKDDKNDIEDKHDNKDKAEKRQKDSQGNSQNEGQKQNNTSNQKYKN